MFAIINCLQAENIHPFLKNVEEFTNKLFWTLVYRNSGEGLERCAEGL